jgi:hypothetical protein
MTSARTWLATALAALALLATAAAAQARPADATASSDATRVAAADDAASSNQGGVDAWLLALGLGVVVLGGGVTVVQLRE